MVAVYLSDLLSRAGCGTDRPPRMLDRANIKSHSTSYMLTATVRPDRNFKAQLECILKKT